MPERAVAHEHFIEYGGGEFVAEKLADLFDAPMYAGATDGPIPEMDVQPLAKTWLENKMVHLSANTRDLLYMLKWPGAPLEEYDTIIQSGNNPGWYVPRDEQTIIKYVHSTPRNPYDLYQEHEHGLVGTVFNHIVRTLYQQTVPYPDVFVANSDLVARRLRRYWDVPESKIEVVYPPVETDLLGPDIAPTEDYYLTWSRLYGHKNIDQIVHAFNRLGPDYPLVIAGEGPERDNLETLADDHIRFAGWVQEREKAELASGAKAVVFAATNEDFGLVPVEAMASGTPVIGVEDGFTQHQILENKNGFTFYADPYGYDADIAGTVKGFEDAGLDWDEDRIAEFAEKNFGIERFNEQMTSIVERAEAGSNISAELEVPAIESP